MKVVALSRGYHALVSDEDYNLVSEYHWWPLLLKKTSYAHTQKNGVWKTMHRVIMDAKKGQMVDHINGDGLDNRRSNLRFCNKSTNGCNRGPDKDNTSGFKGVTYITNKQGRKKRWFAQIVINKKSICVGYFLTKEEAAQAWNIAAKKHHGEFAYQNKI